MPKDRSSLPGPADGVVDRRAHRLHACLLHEGADDGRTAVMAQAAGVVPSPIDDARYPGSLSVDSRVTRLVALPWLSYARGNAVLGLRGTAGDRLVLVVDAGRGAVDSGRGVQRLLEEGRAHERSRPPRSEHADDRTRNVAGSSGLSRFGATLNQGVGRPSGGRFQRKAPPRGRSSASAGRAVDRADSFAYAPPGDHQCDTRPG